LWTFGGIVRVFSGLENPVHVLVVMVVVLLLFGAKRLPEWGRSLGGGMREFKRAITGDRAAELADRREQPVVAGERD
jgi:sec-independent protein translocase protein TatA